MVEYTPHLQEHFVHPAVVKGGRYVAPDAPGYSVTMYPASITAYSYPNGSVWAGERSVGAVAPRFIEGDSLFIAGARSAARINSSPPRSACLPIFFQPDPILL